jgi:hypothetical protein
MNLKKKRPFISFLLSYFILCYFIFFFSFYFYVFKIYISFKDLVKRGKLKHDDRQIKIVKIILEIKFKFILKI